ncbi:arginase family protein [Paramicrobacterium chengjingii]|uniref:Arginase family protein n=1 Tax=Paramicrobacterium chengjingii TaxID=2769067 RepID=A0ABX6YGE3_9MICO|nr:arginase family protein [Microbacterium chengjingii]QPZ37684.1 arginase family protein [Microbacterium chengjingii]
MAGNTAGLSHDDLWPRAGDWPNADSINGDLDLVLVGLPTASTSLSPTRADATPDAVREALRKYSPFAHSADADLDVLTLADAGNVRDPDSDEDAATQRVADVATRSRLVVALGGDNAATVPAALGSWGSDVSTAGLITLDAHYDLRDGRSNGSPVRRLVEAGLDGRRVVQIGIQDFANSRAYAERARDLGITVITRDELLRRSLDEVMAQALEIAGSANGPIHVDLDVDVCDRAVAPACPASTPGGIAAHELRRVARVAARHPSVASLDLTEIDATADAADGRTVRLAALCVLEAAAGLALR